LDVLKWAREYDCPWNEETCESAALVGNLEVLKWAVERGCVWDANECARLAAEVGHWEVAHWADAQP
jgi:hypothetical protein